MKRTLQFLIIIILLFSGSSLVWAEKFYPKDESNKDASFLKFQGQLEKAIEKKDHVFILSIVDPNIKISFGDNGGIEGFKKEWQPEQPNSKLWKVLKKITALGYAKERGTFTAPYHFDRFPDKYNPFQFAAITGKSVNLRVQPSLKSQVVEVLSFDIVEVTDGRAIKAEGVTWLKIKSPNGEEGFVSDKFIQSPIGYRAGFEKMQDKWRMIFFIVGD